MVLINHVDDGIIRKGVTNLFLCAVRKSSSYSRSDLKIGIIISNFQDCEKFCYSSFLLGFNLFARKRSGVNLSSIVFCPDSRSFCCD